jgi:hypothetical protein
MDAAGGRGRRDGTGRDAAGGAGRGRRQAGRAGVMIVSTCPGEGQGAPPCRRAPWCPSPGGDSSPPCRRVPWCPSPGGDSSPPLHTGALVPLM